MSFLRLKKIKGNHYAYLVENLWKKGSRQKVKKYVGRVYSFKIKDKENIGFLSFINKEDIEKYVMSTNFIIIIEDLINWEFYKHGIDNKELNVEFDTPIIKRGGRGVCIKINEGFLCGVHIKSLINFRKDEEDENDEIVGYNLAKVFIDAGINVPQEVFIKIFEKVAGSKNE